MRFPILTAAATVALVAAAGCAFGTHRFDASQITSTPLGLDPVVPTPIDNPPNAAKLELGARLFFDPLLSQDGTRSCASCHRPDLGFGDDSAVSLGIRDQPTRRNAPPLINRAWGKSFFRDGRAPTLEAAVLQPALNPAELGLTLALLEERLAADATYRRLFREAFGAATASSTAAAPFPTAGGSPTSAPVSAAGRPTTSLPTAELAAAALATFIRSLQSGDAPLDRYRAGDSTALSPLQKEGRDLFFGKARCASCHIGPSFTDEGFHNTGVAARSGDAGRYGVTGTPGHEGAFRTPTLRDVALTAPYMHDGSVATLEDVIEFYDEGGVPNPNLDFQIRPIGLTSAEKEALLAFLHALTGVR